MRKFKKLTLLLSVSLLSGCLVGPDYQQSKIPLPKNWSVTAKTSSANPTDDLSRWWQVFNDPMLTQLIYKAQAGNLDLYQAEARLREARARWQLAEANLLPTSSVGVSASQSGNGGSSAGTGLSNRLSSSPGVSSNPAGSGSLSGGAGTTSTFYRGTLDASWEVDLFGKRRRAIESAEASLQAASEDLRDVLVSLCAEVALNYVDVRSFQARVQLTEDNLAKQEAILELTRWRYEAGLSTQLDVDQARLTAENTRSSIPSLRSSLEQAKHNIALLSGLEPLALNDMLKPSKPIPVTDKKIAIGIPADLLRRRPDVRRAERKLAAQTAQIGVAEAERYPTINLTGSIGEFLLYANQFSASGKLFQIAGSAVWTLIDASRIRSNIKIQTALQEQALGLYESSLLTALRDVENALQAYSEEQNRLVALESAEQAADSALKLARLQYDTGLVDFQRVLDSERSLLTAQTQLVASRSEIAADIVRLYKALGGGWPANEQEKT